MGMAVMTFAYRHLVIPFEHVTVTAAGFAATDAALARLGQDGWEVVNFTTAPHHEGARGFAAIYLLRRAGDPDDDAPDAGEPTPTA